MELKEMMDMFHHYKDHSAIKPMTFIIHPEYVNTASSIIEQYKKSENYASDWLNNFIGKNK